MTIYARQILKTFEWHSITAFVHSLMPSMRYKLQTKLMIISAIWVSIDKGLGLDDMAFIALLAVFATELISGLVAARVRKETFSSVKLSRFSLKVTCYLVLIFVSYTFSVNFKSRGDYVAFVIFDWMHIFLIVQIVFENVISILENLAVISGKDKAAWIEKISQKLNSILG